MRRYYIKNENKLSEQNKQWAKNNPEKKLEIDKQWREKNSEYIKQYQRENKKARNEYLNNRRKIDLKFNLNEKVSSLIRYSLGNNKNGCRWENLVGYTLNDLIKRLKKTMPKGYNWNDYINGKLHIDHKIPISAFNFTKPEHPDFKKCWALENLRLLSAKENRIKYNKLEKSFQPALKIEL